MSNHELEDKAFSVTFPLPFRVLFLIGLGIFGWAANVHGLHALGIDAVQALDLRPSSEEDNSTAFVDAEGRRVLRPTANPSAVYTPLYRAAAYYTLFCITAWIFYHVSVQDNPALANLYKFIPSICALCVVISLVNPYDIFAKRFRDAFILSVRRCLHSPANTPIYFSDVVFADVFTSYAKVIGDVWLSICMLLPSGNLLVPPRQSGWKRWILPTLMSLPYAVRLRQCLVEYFIPSNASRRPFFNAIKYASSFPVIYLSAAQRLVVKELIQKSGEHVAEEPWHGEHPLFRLWLLSALVNSLYSFWWDVTNDWGFDMLVPANPPPQRTSSIPRPLVLPSLHERDESVTGVPVRTHAPPSSAPVKSTYPWGLRPNLLFPLSMYPAAIFLDLVLRLTWAVKLSSHLHTHAASEGSALIFVLEVAEIFRRWMWVFFRVEWEVIRQRKDESHNGTIEHDLAEELEMLTGGSEGAFKLHG